MPLILDTLILSTTVLYFFTSSFFRCAYLFAALAMSASLANSIPTAAQEASPAASNVVVHKKIVFKPQTAAIPISEGSIVEAEQPSYNVAGLVDGGLTNFYHLISGPKKLVGVITGYVFSSLKSMDAKKIFKIVLLGAVVTVLGSVAAISVAGLVSIISGICAVLPYVRFFFGGDFAGISDNHVDALSEFVLGAFNKYDILNHQHDKAPDGY